MFVLLVIGEPDKRQRSASERRRRAHPAAGRDQAARLLEEARGNVDCQRENDGVENEGDDAMRQHDPTHCGSRDVDVGGSERAANDERLIRDFTPASFAVAGEVEAATDSAALAWRIVRAGVMQRRSHG